MSRILVQSTSQLNDILDHEILPSPEMLALDTETVGLHHIKDWVVGFSFCLVGKNTSYYVPVAHQTGNIEIDMTASVAAAQAFFMKLKASKKKLVFHHALFDLSLIYKSYSVMLEAAEDTMALAYVLNEDAMGLKELSNTYLSYVWTTFDMLMESVFGDKWKASGYKFYHLTPLQGYEYASNDAYATANLFPILEEKAKNEKVMSIYRLEMLLTPVLIKMNFTGIPIDVGLLQNAATAFAAANKKREQAIFTMIGHQFKLNSPKELREVLFGELKLPVVSRSKQTGVPSTDKEAMSQLEAYHPVVELISAWRSDTKLQSAYSEKIPASVESNGKIYPAFKGLGAVSGRLKSSSLEAHDGIDYGINMQNVAKATFDLVHPVPYVLSAGTTKSMVDGKSADEVEKLGCILVPHTDPRATLVNVLFDADIRMAFVANQQVEEDPWVWVKADFSQIEYRIMASLAGEDRLIQGFLNGIDYHAQTASIMLGVALDQVSDTQRSLGKILNFGLTYGMSAWTLSRRTGMSEAEAQGKYDFYFQQLPKLCALINGVKAFASQNGFVRTYFGRLRRYYLNGLSPNARNSVLRSAFNTLIQGTAADVLKFAMIRASRRLVKYGDKVEMLLNVHDEVDFRVRKSILLPALQDIKYAMEIEAPDGWAPIIAELEIGPTWSKKSLKKVKLENPLPSKRFTGWKDIFDMAA